MSTTLPTSVVPNQTVTRANVGGEIVPLAERVRALTLLRIAIASTMLVLAALGGSLPVQESLLVTAGYLAVATALGLALHTPTRSLGVKAVGIALLLDAVYLEYLLLMTDHTLGVQFALGAFLVAVTLLASFRTGLKIALWASLLLVIGNQAVSGGLIHDSVPLDDLALVAELVTLWLLVLTAATTAAINERELRRRRYDAEALRGLATSLHRSETPDDVLSTLLGFLRDEVECERSLTCRDTASGLILLEGTGLNPDRGPVMQRAAESPLLSMLTSGEPLLTLRLDPSADPWLAEHLPEARRLVGLRLDRGDASGAPVYLVLELARGESRTGRVERRVLSTVEQAAATATLALSRAELLMQARRSASTDGLTGAWNRRTFDSELARNVAAARRDALPVSLIMVDVDHFKQVNDVHGHQVGDEVLVLVAKTLMAVSERYGHSATVYRYGGEEFSVIVTGPQVSGGDLAEQLRASLQAQQGPVPITASFGVAAYGPGLQDPKTLLLRSDQALLEAKQTGRNRVVVYTGTRVPAPSGAFD